MTAEIIIIGGGASGLMAAIEAGKQFVAAGTGAGGRCPVLLLERMDRPGKKILATGNGRCNFSNTYMDEACFRSDTPELVKQVLNQFDQEQTTEFFKELGIMVKNRDGYLYPMSGQASSILDVLLTELERLPVKILTSSPAEKISRIRDGYQVSIAGGKTYTGKKVIMACGGCAYPKLGSDGSGFWLAKSLGHKIIPPVPALTSLYARQDFFKQISGVRADGRISLYIYNPQEPYSLKSEKPAAWDRGELQLTDYGISGIPAFQVSRFASRALAQGKKVTAVVDFMPDMNDGEFFVYLWERASIKPHKTPEQFLTGIFNKKLCQLFIKMAKLSREPEVGNFSKKQIHSLVAVIKGLKIEITKTGDFDHAQVCAGGVGGRELDGHLQSVLYPGLYFTGEIIDVDGICGGYNLQWAWSSGYVAGHHAAGFPQKDDFVSRPKGQ
ncbi:MAG TPA: NAD(P)/FAD-dependent oxidoreductase [Candidatus Scybalocola faecavium]|nr:NAD(P)/FAD-dependent oxidoreductase [Candidatus Scybalocola faecavium]